MIADLSARAALPAAFFRTIWLRRRLRDRASIETYHDAALRRLIDDAARTTSFYRSFASARFTDLPIIDKAAQLADFASFNVLGLEAGTARRYATQAQPLSRFELGQSTGTSGLRGLYVISAAERFRWLGTMLAKVLPDVLTTRHRVAIVLPGPSPLYQSANESRLLKLHHFDARGGMDPILDKVSAFAPTVLLAAPKSLRRLAGSIPTEKLRKIFSAGEVLEPVDANRIMARFPAPVGQIYMATEGLLGTSCAQGFLHLAEDVAHFELLQLGGDPTLVTPLFTDLCRRTQIMARYRLGDVLRRVDGQCPCGSPFHRVRVIGRESDLIKAPSKTGDVVILAPDQLADVVLSAAPNISDYRIGLAEARDVLHVLTPPDTTSFECAAIRTALESFCVQSGAQLRIEIISRSLQTPFDRKLRRVAPVQPETL